TSSTVRAAVDLATTAVAVSANGPIVAPGPHPAAAICAAVVAGATIFSRLCRRVGAAEMGVVRFAEIIVAAGRSSFWEASGAIAVMGDLRCTAGHRFRLVATPGSEW